jgi:uncharacterized protein YbbK (DUF523 family)
MTGKIKIGVSSCLLGNVVRYDGGHKLDLYLRDILGQIVEWVPVCPEVEAGLTVPREPMQLSGDPAAPRLVTIQTGIDHTERVARWAHARLVQLEKADLCGFVFKARSPSCGVHDTKITASSGGMAGLGPGLFAAAFMLRFSSLPVEDEERLRLTSIREDFIESIFACRKR